ncbi:MAG TPA: hypothetical protein VHQ47_17890 [Phycisphaerae bacterium]|jgi:hypothetical protein|nr:hypothetical protein [Phycisphaerae bacterium]
MKPALQDAQLNVTFALPNGAANVSSGGIPTANDSTGDFVANAQFTILAPALTTSQLPDAGTITYDVYQSANADLSSPTVLYPGVLVQTGAGGAGAAAASFDFRVPTNVKGYVFVKATKSGTGNASTSNAQLTVSV